MGTFDQMQRTSVARGPIDAVLGKGSFDQMQRARVARGPGPRFVDAVFGKGSFDQMLGRSTTISGNILQRQDDHLELQVAAVRREAQALEVLGRELDALEEKKRLEELGRELDALEEKKRLEALGRE